MFQKEKGLSNKLVHLIGNLIGPNSQLINQFIKNFVDPADSKRSSSHSSVKTRNFV